MVVLTLMLLSALAGSPASDEAASAAIEDFAWMAGHWRGEGFGGVVEEVWSEPLGGTMVGTFRLVKDGKVAFYEIMVLEPDPEGFVLRVKHFAEDFTAWEEQADSVDFRLEKLEGQVATFNGLTLSRDADALEIKIRMRQKDGSTRWETLRFEASRP
jgi:hypothetical protein